MKGNWRIKVRVVKKGEIKCWSNAKGEGQLINMELMDRLGLKIQATLFKEMVTTHGDTFQVGNCYEICQGIVKKSQVNRMDKEYSQNCFIFDKFSKIKKIEDDFTIPGGEII